MARKDERQSGVDYRIRFFTHKGKEILLVDLSNCSPAVSYIEGGTRSPLTENFENETGA